jgi:hypothetical protein
MNQISSKDVIHNLAIERIRGDLSITDMNDLCDATDEAIKAGGGFGWVKLPARDILERYWNGAIVMPQRDVFVARLRRILNFKDIEILNLQIHINMINMCLKPNSLSFFNN